MPDRIPGCPARLTENGSEWASKQIVMTSRSFARLLLFLAAWPCGAAAQTDRPGQTAASYFPEAAWQRQTQAQAGFNPQRLKEAIDYAIAGESRAPRDLVLSHYQTFGREPFGYAIGPIRDRGDPSGLIIRHGYIVAEWGEPSRVDMTYSVTKSFLSSVVGVAFDRGMIKSIDDTVRDYVAPIEVYNPAPAANKSDRLGAPDLLLPFETPHNRTITLHHRHAAAADPHAGDAAVPLFSAGFEQARTAHVDALGYPQIQ
jgi:CubicO group peptidase (beta-lactamase class C family)